MEVEFEILNDWYMLLFEHGTNDDQREALEWLEILRAEWDEQHPIKDDDDQE